MEFPKTLAAAKKVGGAEWTLADALLAEVGPRGSEARMAECADYLKANGITYSIGTLRSLWGAARAFRPGDRSPWLTPSNAKHAGSPAIVKRAVADKKARGETAPPTQREITSTRRQVVEHARQQSGGTKRPDRKAIRQSAEHAEPHALARAADVLELDLLADHAKRDAAKVLETIRGHKLTARERKDLLEATGEVLSAWEFVRDAIANPVAEEIADFLAQL